MLSTFRERHPWGSIVTDLLRVEEGLYIVRAQAIANQIVLGSGIAGSSTVEAAEDAAIQRALKIAGWGEAALLSSAELAAPTPLSEAHPLALSPSNGSANPYTSDAPAIEPQPVAPAPIPTTPDPLPTASIPASLSLPPEPDLEDLSELIAQTDVELTRIGWGPKEGRSFLKQRFGKQSRQQLNGQELHDFLSELKQKPTQMVPDAF